MKGRGGESGRYFFDEWKQATMMYTNTPTQEIAHSSYLRKLLVRPYTHN